MLVAREYRSLSDVRSALAGRLDRGCAPCMFDRIDWFDALHIHCLADRPLRVIQAVEGNDEAWLFLLERSGRRLSALSNWYSFGWRPIFLGSPAPARQQRLIEQAARLLLQHNARIDLYPIDDSDAMAALVLAAFRRAGWFGVRRSMGGRYLLHRQHRDFATYWDARPGRLRNLVKRKGRGSPFALTIDTVLTDALWGDYEAVHARSWKEPEPGMDFLRALAERESAAGTLRLGFARADGRPVATQLWTVENGTALIHKLSHDQAYDERSPGTLLSHAMFAHAFDVDRVDLIDYGTGDNPYKIEWMEERTTLHRVDCFNPRFASSWIPAARTAISALVG